MKRHTHEVAERLQDLIAPNSEHILDWFHVTMRLTNLKQMAKSFTSLELLADMEPKLEKIKWFLWHGNAFKALQRLDWILADVECYEPDETPHPERYARLDKALLEFSTYIENNVPFIPNYGSPQFGLVSLIKIVY